MRRIYYKIIHDHIEQYHQMLFLSGPRQVGKTTLALMLEAQYKPLHYINWDVMEHRQLILSGPLHVAEHLQLDVLTPTKPLIIFDEIHKFGQWKNFLKGFFDLYHKKCSIIVTGSSRLDVFVRGGDSLMGRYFNLRINPMSVRELLITYDPSNLIQKPQQIDDTLFQELWHYGGFPEPLLRHDARFQKRWQQLRHQQMFEEDIRSLTHVQELDQLETLAHLMNRFSGQQISYASLTKYVAVSQPTVKKWLKVLEDFYYCFMLKPWHKNVTRSLIKEPKLYLRDWSLIEDTGARFETMIANHLYKSIQLWQDLGHGAFSLYYLRDKEQREVDFLVTKEAKPWLLIEAKLSGKERLSKNLNLFQEQLQAEHAFQVVFDAAYIDEDCFKHKTPIIVPAKTFLSQLV